MDDGVSTNVEYVLQQHQHLIKTLQKEIRELRFYVEQMGIEYLATEHEVRKIRAAQQDKERQKKAGIFSSIHDKMNEISEKSSVMTTTASTTETNNNNNNSNNSALIVIDDDQTETSTPHVTSNSSSDDVFTISAPPTQQQQQQRSQAKLSKGLLSRFLTFGRDDEEVYTSDSFHMHAASIVTDVSSSQIFGWAVVSLSVIVIISQFFMLAVLVHDASRPLCNSHRDCKLGEICEPVDWTEGFGRSGVGSARCQDCALSSVVELDDVTLDCNAILSPYDPIDYPHFISKQGWGSQSYTDDELKCFAQDHCNATNAGTEDYCSYLSLRKNNWQISQKLSLIFMSLLLVAPLCSDIQDAMVEERYLDYGLKNNDVKPSLRVAAEVLRLALRTRQSYLPWCAALGVIAILLRDTLDTKNMLLNVIAIEVILIADDMLAEIVKPILNQARADKLAEEATQSGVKVSPIWSRLIALGSAVVLIVTVCNIERYEVWLFGYKYCSDVQKLLKALLIILPLCSAIIHGTGCAVFDQADTLITHKIMRGMIEMATDLIAFSCVFLLSFALTSSFAGVEEVTIEKMIAPILLICAFLACHLLRHYTTWQPVHVIFSYTAV